VKPVVTELERVADLVARGALFVVNHSGGKDSQAMLLRVLAAGVPRDQIVVAHADLSEVEWAGTLEHAERQALQHGLEFVVTKARDAKGKRKSFFDMVARRFATRPEVPSFPSSSTRQCTSDLKRGPLDRAIKALAVQHGTRLIVNCMGMRAQESAPRAKLDALERKVSKETASGAVGEWWDWLPIHHLTTEEVFATIREAGEEPHWAYAIGNERLSCVFCIMGSRNDARNGAIHNPVLFAQLAELEKRTGYTSHMSRRSVEEVAGITVEEARQLHAEVRAGRTPSLPILQEEPTRAPLPCMEVS